MKTTYWTAAIGIGFLLIAGIGAADAQTAKPAIRGLVSMGAFKFVGSGGDPVNTLEPLNAKPGIFGGIVVIASWAQLQPTSASELESSVIDQALADVRDYNSRHPEKPLAVRLRIWGGFKTPGWAMKFGGPPIAAVQAQGATSIELWQDYGGFPTVPDDLLKRWAAMVEANKTP